MQTHTSTFIVPLPLPESIVECMHAHMLPTPTPQTLAAWAHIHTRHIYAHLQHGHVLAGLDGFGGKQDELLRKQNLLQLTRQGLHGYGPRGSCTQGGQGNIMHLVLKVRIC